jgi:hypothetical protein
MKKLILGLASASLCCASHGAEILSKTAQVCAKPLKGVTYQLSAGLDATSGTATDRRGSVAIVMGGHPDIPPAMKIKPAMTHDVPNLPDKLTFLGESVDKNGRGKVGLYGFNLQAVNTDHGVVQYQTLVMLSADDGRRNFDLLRRIGSALYRCH